MGRGQGAVGRGVLAGVQWGLGARGRSMIVTQAIRLVFRLGTTLGMLTTLSITTFSVTTFIIQRHFAQCRIFIAMLSVGMQSVISLSVVVPIVAALFTGSCCFWLDLKYKYKLNEAFQTLLAPQTKTLFFKF
jgi:hypothetical protein